MDCSTIDECLTVITAGIALGLNLPAPAGSRIWEASVHDSEDLHFHSGHATLGFYPTREEAERAVARWVIRQWSASGMTPWGDESADSWLPQRTATDILDIHFRAQPHQHYALIEHVVATSVSGPLTLAEAHA